MYNDTKKFHVEHSHDENSYNLNVNLAGTPREDISVQLIPVDNRPDFYRLSVGIKGQEVYYAFIQEDDSFHFDKTSASYRDGLLTIAFPKAPVAKLSTKIIEIK